MPGRTLFLVVVLLLAVGALIYLNSEGGKYATFSKAQSEIGRTFHVVAIVDKHSIKYDPQVNTDRTFFYAMDRDSLRRPVILRKPPPPDLTMSEQVVLIGKWRDTFFEASDILLKCPSKYKEVQTR